MELTFDILKYRTYFVSYEELFDKNCNPYLIEGLLLLNIFSNKQNGIKLIFKIIFN